MKKLLLLLSAVLFGIGQINAATEKVHVDLTSADIMCDGNATWSSETQTFSWSLPYDNTLKYLGLPKGDYSNYEKIVVESSDLEGEAFFIYIYNGEAYTAIKVSETDVQEFSLKNYLSKNQLADVTDVRLAGGTTSTGSVHVIDLYLETYDDAVPRKKDPDLSFSQSLVLLEVGDAFTAPTLINPYNLPVTYSATSEPAGAITVDAATGAVTLADGELSGTVSATFAGNDEYEAGTANYSITVRKKAIVEGIPTHYSVENTAAGNPDPAFPTLADMMADPDKYYCEPLPDPLAWSDGSGRALKFEEWSKRRGEIAREIQHYEIGEKPAVSRENIEASFVDGVLTVKTTINGEVLTQTARISYPSGGTAPYPLMVGADNNSLPSSLLSSRNIATMNFTAAQVNGYSQMGGSAARDFERLYPEYADNGAYSEWAWGFSRLLDGLEILGPEVTKIDMDHIGVTGCSYAGKMALFCGAFDERVCLTIPQESGGGGCAAWRTTWVHNRDYTKEDAWEGHTNTDGSWFSKEFKRDATYDKNKVFYLPYDHHELSALCCPRGFLMLGNPDYKWLADGSGYVAMEAARKVWEQFGVADRCGYSIIDGHGHCSLPNNQYDVVGAFLDKFMLDKDVDLTTIDNYNAAPIYKEGGARATALEELGQWMDWWESEDHVPNLLPSNKQEDALLFGAPTDIMTATTTDWELKDDETAPSGKMIEALVKNSTCPADKGHALKFDFNAPLKQPYFVYGYVNCAKPTNDAVWIGYDDQTAYNSNGASTKGEWAWKNLYSLLSNADKTSMETNLDAGDHTLYVYTKEAGYKVGLICVSNIEKLDDFRDAIEGIDLGDITTGINLVLKDGDGVKTTFFTLDGRQQDKAAKGLNIIRQTTNDGQVHTQKVIVK
ncbi:MAG: hypothetical protein IJV45_07345 [Prevotella sp.]|nr:hypothetical protein [Prevotella sp.]